MEEENMEEVEDRRTVAVIVPRSRVKSVKSELEGKGLFARRIEKVISTTADAATTTTTTNERPGNEDEENGRVRDKEKEKDCEERFVVFTTYTIDSTDIDTIAEPTILRSLNLDSCPEDIVLSFPTSEKNPAPTPARNPLETAISHFLESHPPPPPLPTSALLSRAPKRWSLYPPLALLPPTSFTSPPWTTYLSTLSQEAVESFYSAITHALSATHLATNAPIPASDRMRKPTGLVPLHGDFGPEVLAPTPERRDLEAAFWASTRQNGIFQTWAPRYSMFSRGNIVEKARVLGFPRVAGGNVADLYAGIGYFVFSYVKAGASTVFAWEINPWSCEALMRGARENGWKARLVRAGEDVAEVDPDTRILLFAEDNKFAGKRIEELGLRGVRHVNLGLLPTSQGSWETALNVVDAEGWVHVHENVKEEEIERKTEEVVREFVTLEEIKGGRRKIVCEHVEKVKTFAPGVVHCVMDLFIY
ncbi:S-adenosylmethionine-dependent methyltransferase [Rhizina undulata]